MDDIQTPRLDPSYYRLIFIDSIGDFAIVKLEEQRRSMYSEPRLPTSRCRSKSLTPPLRQRTSKMPSEQPKVASNKATGHATQQAKMEKIDRWMKQKPKDEPWNAFVRTAAAESLEKRRKANL